MRTEITSDSFKSFSDVWSIKGSITKWWLKCCV